MLSMNALHPSFAISIFLLAFLTAFILNKLFKHPINSKRFESVDGLRGFLAIAVFMHHASIWYPYINTGVWELPSSNLYTQLGHTGVALFFMISCFLFVSKMLQVKDKGFNWNNFFISRFFRLSPLYFFSIAVLVLILLQTDHWAFNTPAPIFAKTLVEWFGFGIFGQNYINNSMLTFVVNAGVVWSLPYEWLLYFSLPVLSILIPKARASIFYILIGVTFVLIFNNIHGIFIEHIFSFLGGAIAPIIMRYNKVKFNINHLFFSLAVIICFGLILTFKSSSNPLCKLVITIAFTIIALGNNLFGLLKSSSLAFLGEISYSTYLLHGMVLFIFFHYLIGMEKMASLSELKYCLVILGITPIVVIVSFLSYQLIELPFMKLSKKIQVKNL